jgi:putative hemolysin
MLARPRGWKRPPGSILSAARQAIEKMDQQAKLARHRIPGYRPNVEFEFEKGHYVVKTAANGAELEACLKLRFEVFHREFLKKRRTIGVDIDKLDLICDHLVIADKRDGRVIGTYRLNCSKFTGQFYSSGEFELGRLLGLPGHKLELGRACIAKEYRNGAVITLLWRGIAEYLTRTESSYLFGCASVKTMDLLEIALVHRRLEAEKLIDHTYGVAPTRKFRVKNLDKALAQVEAAPEAFAVAAEAANALIPALFMSYVKMGAKLVGEPALDRDFRCVDYLTLLKMDELNPLFVRKYKV